jgi:hypothetical protein
MPNELKRGPAYGSADAARRSKHPLWWLGGLTLLLYVALFNRDFSVDGLAYAAAVERGEPLLHSNHLLFTAMHFGAWKAGVWAGIATERSIWWMQGLTMLGAVACVVGLAGTLLPRLGTARAISLAALLAGSFGFWNFAQEPEVYVPPLTCIAWSLYLLRDPERAPGWWRIAVLSGLAILAVLLLQQHVLWYPALLILLAGRLRDDPQRRHKLVVVALVVPLLCLGIYVALGLALGRLGADSWLSWFLGYGFDPERGLSTFRAAPDGLARVAGLGLGLGNLLFPYEIARSWGWIGIAAAVGRLLAGVLGPAWFAALRRRSSDAVAYATMLGANLLFAFWWESRNIEFLLPVARPAPLVGLGARAACGRTCDRTDLRFQHGRHL